MAGKSTGQVGHAYIPGLLTAYGTGADQQIQPQAFGHGGQARGQRRRIKSLVTTFFNQELAQGSQFLAVSNIPGPAYFTVGRAGLALSPESKPHSQFVTVTDRHFEIHFHQRHQPFNRGRSCSITGFLPACVVFICDVAEGFDQQAFFALEMQIDDALAQASFPGNRGHGGV